MRKLFLGTIAAFALQVQGASADGVQVFSLIDVTCPTCGVSVPSGIFYAGHVTGGPPDEFSVGAGFGITRAFTPLFPSGPPNPDGVFAPGFVAGISGKNDNLFFFPPNFVGSLNGGVAPAFFSPGGLGISVNSVLVDLACNGSNSACAVIFDGKSHPVTNIEVRSFAIPGPTIGAGLPGLIVAGGGLVAWRRRKRKRLVLL
jgi:hypothetical protein